VAYFLAQLGILGADSMRDFRRHAFVVILIVAAVITPPDAVSQCLIAIPLYGLYEVSILVAARVTARKAKKELEEEEADRKEMNS
jgi:sec-independent protein translocase protein TatC